MNFHFQAFVGRAFDVVQKSGNIKAYVWFPAATIAFGRFFGSGPEESLAEVGGDLYRF